MEKSAGFIGRGAELATLDDALGRSIGLQTPQTVTLIGAAGLGKTHLLDAWLAAHARDELRVVRVAVDAIAGTGAPPRGAFIAHLLRVRFGLSELGPDEALLRFRAELQATFADRRISELATLLGRFLGFDEQHESPLVSALTSRPEQAAELAHAVLARFLEQDAAGRPLVIVGENLQDADDESLSELESLAAELTGAPMLIIAAARPDLLVRRPGWGRGAGTHTRIDLQPFDAAEAALLIAVQLGAGSPPSGLVERLMEESGGSPLLVDEILRGYREQEILVRGPRGWRFDRNRAAPQYPTVTREEAAHARITALTPAERDVLARAAVFGEQFWTGGVVALGRMTAAPPDEAAVFAPDPTIAEIHQILENLRTRGFVQRVARSSIPDETAWAFSQAIERRLLEGDTTAELARRRKVFAVQWLESRGGPAGALRLQVMARLYDEAGDPRRAAYCCLGAASLSRDRLRLDRALALYLAGIRGLDLDDAITKLDALYAVGDVAARLGQTLEAVAFFQEMLRLAWRLDLPAKGGAAHGRIGRLLITLGENGRALSHLELAHKLFEVAGDGAGVAAALDDVGRVLFLMGDPARSLEQHRAALVVRERLGDDRGRALTLSRLGQVLRATGALAQAYDRCQSALELRRRISDLPGVIASLLDLGALERDLGRRDKALSLLGEGRELARTGGERLQECSFSIEIGECHLRDADPKAALDEFQAAREIARQFGARSLLSEATRGIAEAELAMGEAARARDDARSAFEIAERVGAPPLAGAALRVAAAAVGAGAPGESDLGGAREMFDRAVAVLTGAGAELELARTLDAYAAFEDRSGRDDTASELRRQAGLIRRPETQLPPAA